MKISHEKKVFLYARVSTQNQANAGNLDRQIVRLTDFALGNGYVIGGIYKDIASGLNENRKGLSQLIKALEKEKVDAVIIEYKDRLARFGFSYIENHIQTLGSNVVILEDTQKDEQQELVEDLISITTSFSARIYGKRGGRKVANDLKKIMKEG